MSRHLVITLVVLCAVAIGAYGAPWGEPVQVSVNAHAGRGLLPKQPTTAVTASGRQLVVWMQEDDPDGPVVWGRILDDDGQVAGSPFRVERSGADATDPAVVARGRRDEFLVAWTELGFQERRVVARRFDRDGSPLGDEFVITDAGQEPALTYSGKRKEFTVVWREFALTASSRIYGATVPAGGAQASEPFLVSHDAPPEAYYHSPEIAHDSHTGGYLVVWERFSTETGESRALMRKLPPERGGELGRQRRIAEPGSVHSASPRVTYNRQTREYLVFWVANGSPVRRVSADGRPRGSEVRVKRATSFEQAAASDIAVAPDGHYEILLWGDELEESPGSAVFRRRMGAELKLGRRLRRVSSADPRITGRANGVIAYSRSGGSFRAVWVEGRERRDPNQFPGDPPSNWEVWARVL